MGEHRALADDEPMRWRALLKRHRRGQGGACATDALRHGCAQSRDGASLSDGADRRRPPIYLHHRCGGGGDYVTKPGGSQALPFGDIDKKVAQRRDAWPDQMARVAAPDDERRRCGEEDLSDA